MKAYVPFVACVWRIITGTWPGMHIFGDDIFFCFIALLVVDIIILFIVHPRPRELVYSSTSCQDQHPHGNHGFAALLDCVPGIMLLLLLDAFIYLALLICCTCGCCLQCTSN